MNPQYRSSNRFRVLLGALEVFGSLVKMHTFILTKG